ncbi:Lar family restriction alleviation protein [Eubacterium sp.]|uniref:Lar family restriction alleviation protein n=1 Tax=Eubacterium sp. TaxID=142586 RepID=UPI003FA53F89
MNKLKPCPFCGGKAELNTIFNSKVHWDLHKVECKKCHTKTDECETRGIAIESWNKRALSDDLVYCKDCKYAEPFGGRWRCDLVWSINYDLDFCSNGCRRRKHE